MPTQSKIGWRPYVNPSITSSSLWNSIYSVYNADTVGSSSLKTSLYAAYNGESNTNDSFGTNNGTAQGGLTYGNGKIGNAFNFNGSNAYVGLPNNSLNFTSDFSISLWVYLTAFPGEQIPIGNYYESSPSAGNSRGWMIYMTGQNLYWIVCGSSQVNLITSISSFQNTWKQITITFKNGVGSKIYFDGNLVTSNSSTISPIYNSTQTPFIGKYQYGNGSSFGYMSANSKIDAVNIYQKELTASEVSELYNSGNGAQYIGDNFYKPTTNDALLVNNGTTVGGLTYGLGKVGTAFVFNGTTSYVRFPDNAFNSLTGSFSVSAWFKTASSISNVSNYILNNISANTWFNNGNGFDVQQYGNVLNFTIFNNTNTETVLGANYTFSTNTWYHVTATKLANGNMNLYLNGSLVGTKVTSVNPTYLATVSKPCIGALNIPARGSVGYFAQSGFAVDALSTWNRELTATEVTELYNSGNGKQYVSSLDSDAQAFIASAAITVTTQQTAINTLVTDLKAANIWTKMKAIYPFVGGTAAQHRFNLKSPGTTAADFYLDFIGGSIHSATGYLLNGVSAYSDTKLNTKNILTPNNLSIGFYTNTNRAAAASRNAYGNADNGGYTPITQFYLRTSSDQLVSDLGDYNYGRVSGANTTTSGMYINTRTASNSMKVFKNGSLFGSSTQNNPTNTLPNCNLPIGAFSLSGAMSGYESINYQFFYVSDGLTDAEALAFYTAVQKYQTTLGRQV